MKLNSIIYNKLVLQADAAKELGLEKLASNILNSIGSYSDDNEQEYSYEELSNDIEQDLWKIATKVINYYNLKSVKAENIDESINILSKNIIKEFENSMNVDKNVTLEPKLFGQK